MQKSCWNKFSLASKKSSWRSHFNARKNLCVRRILLSLMKAFIAYLLRPQTKLKSTLIELVCAHKRLVNPEFNDYPLRESWGENLIKFRGPSMSLSVLLSRNIFGRFINIFQVALLCCCFIFHQSARKSQFSSVLSHSACSFLVVRLY